MSLHPDLRPFAEKLAGAERLFVLTGAGVSAESGLGTFRGAGGHWRGNDPMRLASPGGFADDPKLVWEFYDERRVKAAAAEPNPAHIALASLEKAGLDVFLMSQNVDDLHERAGSAQLAKLHGRLFRSRCFAECGLLPFDDAPRGSAGDLPPKCPQCGGLLRPDVVWFGEGLPEEPFQRFEEWLAKGPVDGAMVIGTSAQFAYLHMVWVNVLKAGAVSAEINLEDMPMMPVDHFANAKAGEVLPALCEAILAGRAL